MEGSTSGLKLRVNLTSKELDELKTKLRTEHGPAVVDQDPRRSSKLKEMLALAEKDIEDRNSEIARLHDQPSLLSPIRRLLNETLLSIFEYLRDENLIKSNPFRIAQYLSERDPNPKNKLKDVFTRARQQHGISASHPIGNLPAMAVSAVSSRWLELISTVIQEFFVYHGSLHPTLSTLQFPLLATLDLNRGYAVPESADLDPFEHSSRLSALALPRIPQDESKIPYHQLDYANFAIGSKGLLEANLRKFPSLKTLAVHYDGPSDSDPQVNPDADGVWQNITSLHIGEYSMSTRNTASNNVFPSFTFPSLNTIHITRLESLMSGPWPKDPFIAFLHRSSCRITTFAIMGISISDLDFIAVLRYMPSLLCLEIDNMGSFQGRPSFAHLEIDDSEVPQGSQYQRNPITPHLISSLILPQNNKPSTSSSRGSRLCVCISVPGSERQIAMSAMGMSCIRIVALKFKCRDVDVEVYRALGVLDEQGLQVTVAGENGVRYDTYSQSTR
ncbi:hypothetical protein BDP27DRAFT_1417424 [Rhodocollybia butyracea]|uniref:Uncharacterized protein n=1 Tax=Rhodocollybia butyracea TaxID=206335 RepID=A0A9P5PVL4_9AGAR|nr:hypothetical protein BDP27DRAFT_1417424 [Rhodocollybia butyracea]